MRHLGFLFALAALLLANTAEAGRNNCCRQTRCQQTHVHRVKCHTCCTPAPSLRRLQTLRHHATTLAASAPAQRLQRSGTSLQRLQCSGL